MFRHTHCRTAGEFFAADDAEEFGPSGTTAPEGAPSAASDDSPARYRSKCSTSAEGIISRLSMAANPCSAASLYRSGCAGDRYSSSAVTVRSSSS